MKPHEDAAIGCYRSILARSEAMLQSAQDEAWSELTGAISDYVSKVEQLMRIEEAGELDAAQRDSKRELLGRILANEKQLDAILQARMTELAGMMDRAQTQLSVEQAYGPRMTS